jgi:hypothetical protein
MPWFIGGTVCGRFQPEDDAMAGALFGVLPNIPIDRARSALTALMLRWTCAALANKKLCGLSPQPVPGCEKDAMPWELPQSPFALLELPQSPFALLFQLLLLGLLGELVSMSSGCCSLDAKLGATLGATFTPAEGM